MGAPAGSVRPSPMGVNNPMGMPRRGMRMPQRMPPMRPGMPPMPAAMPPGMAPAMGGVVQPPGVASNKDLINQQQMADRLRTMPTATY